MNDIFENVKMTAENNKIINETDYTGGDGLLYCGVCNEPKQFIDTVISESPLPCICSCEKAAAEAERQRIAERDRKIAKQQEIAEALHDSFPNKKDGSPNERRNYTFASDNGALPEAMKKLREYAENFESNYKNGKGLYIYGNTGTGKTYSACCIANELIDSGNYSVFFLKACQFGNIITDQKDKQGYINKICSYDLLIIDDFGAERSTAFGKEQMFNLIDTRIETGLPVIFTSNLDFREEIWENTDTEKRRIYDRIIKLSEPVEMIGKSQRKISAAMEHRRNAQAQS